MSEDVENTTTWQSDPRLRYVVPVIILLGLILLILALAASCSGRGNEGGLKPFRPTQTQQGEAVNGEVLTISFVDLNGDPAAYQNQRIRVTGNKITILPSVCRLYTGPVFSWGLIAEDLQLNSLGFAELAMRLPDGLTMTVEGIWRKYDGPLGCGKGPDDGVAWYLQVERIISPNPLPLMDAIPFATMQVLLGTRTSVVLTPFAIPIQGTAVSDQPTIGITPLSTETRLPDGTQFPPGTVLPTSTPATGIPTATRFPGLTPSVTPRPNGTTVPGAGTSTSTPTATRTPISGSTAVPTIPGLPTSPGYPGPGPSTTVPTIGPYS